jgi:hypothetical protein
LRRRWRPVGAKPDGQGESMKDKGFLIVAAVIAAAIVADVQANDARASFFLAHKVIGMVEYLSFWR